MSLSRDPGGLEDPGQDISLWLSGEAVGAAADRAVAGLIGNAAARRGAGDAVAIEDIVRVWYGGIPLPPPEPHQLQRRERRSLASAAISAAATGMIAAGLLAGGPVACSVVAAAALSMAGPRPVLASSSWWQLREAASAAAEKTGDGSGFSAARQNRGAARVRQPTSA